MEIDVFMTNGITAYQISDIETISLSSYVCFVNQTNVYFVCEVHKQRFIKMISTFKYSQMSESIETSSPASSANQITLNTHRCQCVATSSHVVSANKI